MLDHYNISDTNCGIKICTKCNNEYPATVKYWYRQAKGKYGLTAVCKKCVLIYRRQLSSTEEYKKRHKEKMAKWRAENPERALEISRKNYKLNGAKHNNSRKERYKNNPEVRQKVYEREKKYKTSGRRYEINRKPENMEKAIIRSRNRRTNPEKLKHDYQYNAEWRESNRERLHESHRTKRKELYPSYVAQSMRVGVGQLTPEILEAKRMIIRLKRELKKNNVKIR